MPILLIEKGTDRGKSAKYQGTPLVVGRSGKADFTLTDSQISREHFRIFEQNSLFYIEPLKSLNPTLVNSDQVEGPTEIKDGDQIDIGETRFTWSLHNEVDDKDPIIGKTLAGYDIERRLGRGGMGTVYLGRQKSLDRSVAIKILNPTYAQDKAFIKQFVEEARASATLNHPNILQIYDVRQDEGLYFFSMEYAVGGTLQDLIQGQQKLPLKESIAYMIDTAKGLEYAERKQMVHRDIKPDNLMISEDDVLKIGDLGLAKKIDPGSHKKEGKVYGTPHFIAPEQAKNEALDHRADMYAFGASFYRILSGRTPFQASNSQALVMKHLTEEPVPLQEVEPDLPTDICKLIHRLMQKNPDDRYQSNTDLIEELEKIQKRVEKKEKRKSITVGRLNKAAPKKDGKMRKTVRVTRNRLNQNKNEDLPLWLYLVPIIAILLLIVLALMINRSNQVDPENNDTNHTSLNNEEENTTRPNIVKEPRPPRVVKEKTPEELSKELYEAAKYSEKLHFTTPRQAIEKYRKLILRYPNFPEAKKAKQDINRLKKIIVEEKNEEIQSLIQSQKPLDALKQLSYLIEENRDSKDIYEKILEERSKLEKIFRKEFVGYDNEFSSALEMEKEDYVRGKIKLLEDVQNHVSPGLRRDIMVFLKKWQGRLEKTTEEESSFEEDTIEEHIPENDVPEGNTPEDKKTESLSHYEIFQAYKKRFTSQWQSYKFAEAAKKVKSLSKGKSRSHRTVAKNIVRDLRVVEKVFQQLGKLVSTDRHPRLKAFIVQRIAKKIKNLPRGSIRVEAIRDGKISIQILMAQGGKLRQEVALTLFTPEEVYKEFLMSDDRVATRVGWFGIAIYCFYCDFYSRSWDAFEQSLNNSEHGQVLKKYLNTVEEKAEQEYRLLVEEYQHLKGILEDNKANLAPDQTTSDLQSFQEQLNNYEQKYQATRFHQKQK